MICPQPVCCRRRKWRTHPHLASSVWWLQGRRVYPSAKAATFTSVDKRQNYNAECNAPPVGWWVAPGCVGTNRDRRKLSASICVHLRFVFGFRVHSRSKFVACHAVAWRRRIHSRSGSNLPHSYTRREPILLFLSEFRDFQLTCRNRERTTRMETATGRWI